MRQRGTVKIVATFVPSTCHPCPARTLCTASKRGFRQLTVPPHEVYEIQKADRAARSVAPTSAEPTDRPTDQKQHQYHCGR
jgi:hypothetical protein